jgi:DnaJ domain
MTSPVRALSNHYETLQVSQSATRDEIVQAFASLMRAARMRPDISVVRLAQLSVAYETLRDPAKRRAYDSSIGLDRELAPPKVSPFIGAPVIDRLNRIAERSPGSPPEPRAPLATEARAEPRVAAFIAASLREPTDTPEQKTEVPVSRLEPQPPAEPSIDHASTPADERLEIEDGRLSIGRTGATLTAGVIGVAFLAFAAALPDRNPDRLPVRGSEAEPGLTVPLPPATSNNDGLASAQPLVTATAADATPSPRLHERAARAAPLRKPWTTPWLALNENQPATPVGDKGESQSLPSETVAQQPSGAAPAAEIPAAAADPAPVTVPAATLPLASSTIARTIERIGYGCGRVVSETGVEGSAGVFNITCSSGDTYRAAPVRGRYHFRRTGSN